MITEWQELLDEELHPSTVKAKVKETLKSKKKRLFNFVPKNGKMYHPLLHSLPHMMLAATLYLKNISVRGTEKARIILTIKRVIENMLISSKHYPVWIKIVTINSSIAQEFYETAAVVYVHISCSSKTKCYHISKYP